MLEENTPSPKPRKRIPSWIKSKLTGDSFFPEVRKVLHTHRLSTVCQEARCPNLGHCWSLKHATFMILGNICTRGCRFCAVNIGNPGGEIDREEPQRVAWAVKSLNLKYVVLTSVTRDDLPDGGASIFKETVEKIKALSSDIKVEVLIPDFLGNRESLLKVLKSNPEVIGHNLETVERLTPLIRHQKASYELSLSVLKSVRELNSSVTTKSGLMVGLGEEKEEIVKTMADLKKVDVDIVTLGQYLQPTKNHPPVSRYYHPNEFEELKLIGLQMGFKEVISGPLVRSSYIVPS